VGGKVSVINRQDETFLQDPLVRRPRRHRRRATGWPTTREGSLLW